jgi:glutamate racemase
MSTQAIGIFDSGVGGTSIWKELNHLLPNESTIYLADSKHAPYGTKSKDAIVALCIKNTELLIEKGCKLIVVACNTATTNAIHYLRSHYDVPFIGIEPAIKPAALNTQTKAVGILATQGTLSSQLFNDTSVLYANGVKIIEQIGEGIVPLVEQGLINSEAMHDLLKVYIKPMLEANIDYLVLGCTHYPYLIPQLLDLLPNHVKIIDSGEAVAKQTKAILTKHDLINTSTRKPQLEFYTNSNPKVLSTLLGENYKVDYLDF